jgi:hypothetical protein
MPVDYVRDGRYTKDQLDSMTLDQIKAVIDAETEENERIVNNQAFLLEAKRKAEIRVEAKDLAETAHAEMLPMDELKKEVDRQYAEAERQEKMQRDVLQLQEDEIYRSMENMSPEEIKQAFIKAENEARVNASPEGQLAILEEDLAKRVENLNYVHEQLQGKSDKQLREMAREVISEESSKVQESLELQRRWVSTHPEYITSEANGNAMRDFVRDSGFSDFSMQNLELAYTVLKGRGLLQLRDAEELQRLERIQQQTNAPTKRASSVPTRYNAGDGFYKQSVKHDLSEDELYELPLEELERRAGGRS